MLQSLSGNDQLLNDEVLKIIDTATMMNRMTAMLLQTKAQNMRYSAMLAGLQRI